MTDEPQGRAGFAKRALVIFAFLLSIAAAAAGGAGWWGYDRFHRPATNTDPVRLVIAPGSSLMQIAEALADNGLVADARIFALGARLLRRDRRLTAGEYEFAPGLSVYDILTKLEEHDTVARFFTAAEGLSSYEITALLNTTDGLTGRIEEPPPEGALLPETYRYALNDSREAILGRMADGMAALRTSLWDRRAEGLPIDTWEEAVILASIVEKETGVADERPRVASVFVNRLRRGMRLQSDPTVIYGITLGRGPLDRRIRRSELRERTPYNTYVIDGLPPTPIANPGRAAIEAVLNPLSTDDLYFVADGEGGHAFAKTLEEHNRNVAKWRAIQRARGER